MPDKNDLYVAVIAVLTIALWTTLTGLYGARARSTSDFLRASRTVGPRWNAAAISGEYLSAASFLGIAGLVFKGGVDALWYPVGFAAGYLAMLLFVAAPLRRSGAYTLPDFAEIRLGSVRLLGPVHLRQICTAFVVIIGWLYLVPQLQGAGLTLQAVTDQPKWVGATVVMVIVTFSIYSGRLRSITLVQAFQYWIKLTALAVPVFVLLIHSTGENQGFRNSLGAPAPPSFSQATDVTLDHDVELQVTEPVSFTAVGRVDGQPVQGVVRWKRGSKHRVGKDTTLYFDAGSPVPVVEGAAGTNSAWLRPMSHGEHPLLTTYSLMMALLLGTMGLPQVLGRYYTDPDGRTARRTTQDRKSVV